MSAAKHTPGPWAYSTSQEGWSYTINIFQADNAAPTDGWSDIGYIVKTCTGEQQAIQHANARLIAAAPELLTALIELLPTLEDQRIDAKARAAIAKATGATS